MSDRADAKLGTQKTEYGLVNENPRRRIRLTKSDKQEASWVEERILLSGFQWSDNVRSIIEN